jgi:hypothetical protein
MKTRTAFLAVLLAGRLHAQETHAKLQLAAKPVFRVLEESVVRKPNGDTVTFKKVEPPPPLPAATVPAQPAQLLSADDLERNQRLESKEMRSLSVSATVHAGGMTVLRWSCHGKYQMRAVCNVDLRHLAELGCVETEPTAYTIYMGLGMDDGELSAEEALAAKTLPADGKPAFVLLGGVQVISKEDQQAITAMEALLAHYAAHRTELVAQYEQREVERAAQEQARQNVPPPGPRHAVIHFWPLQAAQRAALQEKMARERGTK